MDENLSWKEIQERYKDEWVVLEGYDWPQEVPVPKSGVVKLHAKTRGEFDRLLEQHDDALGTDIAIVFTGQRHIKGTMGFRNTEWSKNA